MKNVYSSSFVKSKWKKRIRDQTTRRRFTPWAQNRPSVDLLRPSIHFEDQQISDASVQRIDFDVQRHRQIFVGLSRSQIDEVQFEWQRKVSLGDILSDQRWHLEISITWNEKLDRLFSVRHGQRSRQFVVG